MKINVGLFRHVAGDHMLKKKVCIYFCTFVFFGSLDWRVKLQKELFYRFKEDEEELRRPEYVGVKSMAKVPSQIGRPWFLSKYTLEEGGRPRSLGFRNAAKSPDFLKARNDTSYQKMEYTLVDALSYAREINVAWFNVGALL